MGERDPQPLRLFGAASDASPLDWDWVEQQLVDAGTYWVVSRGAGHPHPRPVWGIWTGDDILLSVGSPVVGRELEGDERVTVHLESGTDVVIVEGRAATVTDDIEIADFVITYDDKYDWNYSIDEYGPPTRIDVERVLAWRAGGWAGRDGFQQVGKWTPSG